MTLSVIIPVYNVEHTLERCVRSVIRQRVAGGMEIILVDDGSTDGSSALCDSLAGNQQMVTVVHKENGGLSDARNAGLDVATGDYITFIDSDDELGDGTLEPLIDMMNTHDDYDLLEYEVWLHYDTPEQKHIGLQEREFYDMSEYWCNGKAYAHSYAWNKIYRRRVFDGIRYPKGRLFEDIWTLSKILKTANTVATTSMGIYCYHDNPGGITRKAGGEALTSLLEAHADVLERARLIEPKGFSEYYLHVVNIQLDVYRLTGKILLEDFSQLVTLGDLSSHKDKIKAVLLKTLGLNRLCKIHKYLKSNR